MKEFLVFCKNWKHKTEKSDSTDLNWKRKTYGMKIQLSGKIHICIIIIPSQCLYHAYARSMLIQVKFTCPIPIIVIPNPYYKIFHNIPQLYILWYYTYTIQIRYLNYTNKNLILTITWKYLYYQYDIYYNNTQNNHLSIIYL